MSDDRVEQLLLTQEIATFLYTEAELLDERRHDEWLALLAEDIAIGCDAPQRQIRRHISRVHP